MDKYKAVLPVGGYEVGDEVPEDKALLWNEMYEVFHCVLEKDYDEYIKKHRPEPSEVYIMSDEPEEIKAIEEVEPMVRDDKIEDFDINNDGKVDHEDVSLMGKGLRKFGRKGKKK